MSDTTEWDGACAASQLLKTAADLVRDETPFHYEIGVLCHCALMALRRRRKGRALYTEETYLPEETFRQCLHETLEWGSDEIDEACEQVRADMVAKDGKVLPGPMAAKPEDVVRVGVALLVYDLKGRLLLGKRKGAHGAWSVPGGHLEFMEIPPVGMLRELKEETGIDIKDPGSVTLKDYTSTYFVENGRHYITLFGVVRIPHQDAIVMEPDRCERWEWCSACPGELFAPLHQYHASHEIFTHEEW